MNLSWFQVAMMVLTIMQMLEDGEFDDKDQRLAINMLVPFAVMFFKDREDVVKFLVALAHALIAELEK